MEHSNLYDLIACLEYGTNIHISVVFLDNFGNYKTDLIKERVIHSKPFCTFMKSTQKGYRLCVSCRNRALKKAVSGRKPFGGLCFNGIYEYCHPVVGDNCVIAVIFIGNILSESSKCQPELTLQFTDTFERGFGMAQCRRFCSIIENHIKLLVYEYSDIEAGVKPLIANIINYIEESAYYDVSVGKIADIFNYNENYIGKLFKKQTGKTIKEYLNGKRLKKSEELLKKTTLTITEIAASAGFNNVTYFNRLFKKQFLMSPTEYRNISR